MCENMRQNTCENMRPNMRRITTLLTVLVVTSATIVAAQTAHFGGVQSTIGSGLSECFGVAVDGNGNVYIADTYNNRVLKETPSAGGYSQSVVAIDLNKPYGVAVDGNGNVYVADSYNFQIVKETLSGGSYTPSVVVSGLPGTPFDVAVDGSGNVYFPNGIDNQVLKEAPSGGGYIQSVVADAASNGINSPWEVAVDGSGDVYITDNGNERVLKETYSGGGYTQSTVVSGLNFPTGIAVDGSGDVYIANTYSDQILKETLSGGSYVQSILPTGTLSFPYEIAVDGNENVYIANPQAFDVLGEFPSGGSFGSVDIGSQSSPLSLVFAFDTAGSIGAPAVVTQGAANLDFEDAGNGNCTSNGSSVTYTAGETCVVDAVFIPTRPGTRYGAVELQDKSGNTLATGYVQGTGVGPQVDFLPGTLSTLGSGFGYPSGVAVDVSGNVFVADTDNGDVKEILAAGGYTTVKTLGSGFDYPQGVAVDGSGNVFVADTSGGAVKEIVAAGGFSTIKTLGNGFQAPTSIAVDGNENVFVADQFVGVKEILAAGGYTTVKTLGSGFELPVGVAVDGNGNVFVADAGNDNNTVKEILAEGGYTQINTIGSGFDGPQNVALDAAGNVYVADAWNQKVKEVLAAGGYTTVKTLVDTAFYFYGVAVDQAGNVYIANTYDSQIMKADFADPPMLKFATTANGSTSLDSPQGVTVENNGNAALNFWSISYPASFPESSQGTTDCSKASPLPADASCTLTIDFSPAAVGSLSGSLVLTDNNLNASAPNYAVQSIALNGTSTKGAPAVSVMSAASPIFLSSAVTFTAIVSSTVGNPTGTVSFYDGTTFLGSDPLSAPTYTTSGLAAGLHSITAVYSGDANFNSGTSTPFSETVVDFTIALSGASGASGSVTAKTGGQASYPLVVTPVGGTVLPGAVSLSVTGLPTGATATFTPATVAASSGTTNVTLLVTLPSQSMASAEHRQPGRMALVALGLLLLPFAGRFRKMARSWNRIVCLLLLVFVGAAVVGTVGCNGGSAPTPPPQSYTLTVTASAGSLSHSTMVSLTVQ
jgi:sugar lactone lactonase YvrE